MFCSTSFVLCTLVCPAADALVVVAGFRYNGSVHFAAAVFARGKKTNKEAKRKKKKHCRVKLSILDPLSRKWHSTVIEHIVKMQILLITRYGSRYICLASKLQELYYFSRKIIKC